jgi:hypothetical protein
MLIGMLGRHALRHPKLLLVLHVQEIGITAAFSPEFSSKSAAIASWSTVPPSAVPQLESQRCAVDKPFLSFESAVAWWTLKDGGVDALMNFNLSAVDAPSLQSYIPVAVYLKRLQVLL